MSNDFYAFIQLRNFYRDNFIHGDNDEYFLRWCEAMSKELKNHRISITHLSGAKGTKEEGGE